MKLYFQYHYKSIRLVESSNFSLLQNFLNFKSAGAILYTTKDIFYPHLSRYHTFPLSKTGVWPIFNNPHSPSTQGGEREGGGGVKYSTVLDKLTSLLNFELQYNDLKYKFKMFTFFTSLIV